jgi:signal transduction histidine kinase/ActR/RegA family two-component response regulator
VLVRASPFRDETGVLRWFGTVTDIDTLKRAEEELREAHRMQAVKSLAGGVAHEINNHMTAVLGFGHFVLRALGADHEQAPDLRVVLQSADRAARVSQHLLAFTRQQVTQRSEVDLAAIVLDLEPLLAQILGPEKHLAIRSLGPATAPSVLADPDHVKQVLVDLVANARDATETGAQVEITMSEVRLERDLPAPLGEMVPAGRYVRLGVSDTGSGIPPEVLPRIFDPFFTTKSVGAGSGLGLSMVHGTLRRHGGYVRAESMPGVGTTIHLFWPLADHEATVVPADRPEGSRSTRSSGDLTVMVVEDEPHVRGLAVRALREVGFRVEDAADGRAALDRLEHTVTPPDVLVADLLMPRVNGRQLVDAVRERWPAMPVLFISGDAGATDADRRLIPSDVPLLRKPFTPEDFVEAVGKLAKVAAFASSEEAP